ncbi:MAG: TonB-dependent receptor, partial [Rhodospirillales bacterium]|nr:TonB-dependent receptor [Acetobacter sp.]
MICHRVNRGFVPRFHPALPFALLFATTLPLAAQEPSSVTPGHPADQPQQGIDSLEDRIVITGTRLPVAEDQSPAAVTVIPADELAQRQTDRVADALRAVPGVSVSQSGAPGQLTSVFTRGLNSDQTQVLIDGIPFNQGLAGQFNFADLTGDGIERIEVERGPQSTVYGPRAAAGTIQLFTRRGDALDPAHPFSFDASSEGGSFGTYRERLATAGVLGLPPATAVPASKDGKDGGNKETPTASTASSDSLGVFDYSVAFSRLDTDNQRPNNEYRNTAVLANLGFAPRALTLDTLGGTAPRLGVLVLYSLSDASSPNTIFAPTPLDNLLTERQLYAPNVDWQLTRWWHHRLVLEYD